MAIHKVVPTLTDAFNIEFDRSPAGIVSAAGVFMWARRGDDPDAPGTRPDRRAMEPALRAG